MTTSDHPTVPGLRLQRLLGEGACGRVFEAVGEGGRVCAVKVLDPEAINYTYLEYCYSKIMGLAPHPNLVPVGAFYADETDGSAVYTMPLYGQPAEDGVGMVSWTLETVGLLADRATAWRWVSELAEGLAHLHLHAVVHCNFKPSNVFIDSEGGLPRAVTGDYGQGWIGGVEALPLSDHVLYAPPEQLRRPTQIQFGTGERWDVYAFGVTAYRLLTGLFPRGEEMAARWRQAGDSFELPDPMAFAALVEQETSVGWPAPPDDEAEEARRAVIEKCLRLAPGERWVDMREVRDALAAVDQLVATQAAQAGWEAEREQWRLLASGVAAAPVETGTVGGAAASSGFGRRSGRGDSRSATWLAWTTGVAAAGAAVLGVLYGLEHAALRGARAVAAEQAAELTRLAAERADGFASRDQALAEAKRALEAAVVASQRAEAKLADTQAAADHFFGSFLEAASQLPADGERARLLLAGYDHFATFIATHGDRPEFAQSVLRARCHVAAVKLALGAPQEAADKYDEARVRILDFLAAHPGHADAAELRLRAADCVLQAGRLRLDAGQTDPAILGGLSSALAEVTAAAAAAGDPPDLMRRIADGELVLAQAELARMNLDVPAVTARAQRAADITHQLLSDPRHSQPGDKVRLGRALLLRGRLERRGGDIEPALATQVETAQTLLECGDQPEALDLLAQCYGETGAMLQGNGEVRDAVRAQGEAVKILSDLVKASPGRSDYRLALAARYGDLAQLLRENGQAPRALDYQRGAVELLQSQLARDAGNVAIATTLARLRADLSDLLAFLDQKPEAMVQAREALALLDRLNLPGPPASTVDLSYRVTVARSYGVVGEVAEEAKQLAEAKSCFEKAVAHYETAAAASPRDGVIDRGLTESRLRLARLNP
jgi:tetratricopeptide (TPR) repeat protein